MKKKLNHKLLAEERKKFKMLSEYSFYTGDNKLAEVDGDEQPDPAEEEPEMDLDADGADAAASDIGSELGVDDAGGEESTPPAAAAPAPVAPPAEPATDDVEVDVTSLVKGSDEAKDAANHASKNTTALLAKFNDLENKVASMGAIASKIDTLEKEIVRRNPTPVEKLEMRSLDSFPYSVKLSDYWADKEGPYDVMKDNQPETYTLTQDDVDSDYSDASIKQTFNPKEYEEEDIDE